MLSRLRLIVGLLLALGVVSGPARAQATALFTTLPLLWDEEESVAALLRHDHAPHWALAVLGERGRVVPLDTLALIAPEARGKAPLHGVRVLVMAQPRPLSPQENVALDRWVRGGGRVLLFADPLLTAESRYALGDKRRPQDVALLSPILTRWHLTLTFDEDQPPGEHQAELLGHSLPVNMAGRYAVQRGHRCRLLAQGLAAQCRVGRGSVVAVADAALLERGAADEVASRGAALRALIALAAR